MPRAATFKKREHSPIPISRLISHSWIWAGTVTQWFTPPAKHSKRNSYVFRDRLNGVIAPMEASYVIALAAGPTCGRKARLPGWSCRFLKAIPGFRFSGASAHSSLPYLRSFLRIVDRTAIALFSGLVLQIFQMFLLLFQLRLHGLDLILLLFLALIPLHAVRNAVAARVLNGIVQ